MDKLGFIPLAIAVVIVIVGFVLKSAVTVAIAMVPGMLGILMLAFLPNDNIG